MNLYKDGVLILLSKREKEFFYFMIKNKNVLVLTEDIKKKLWNEDVSDERLRTFVKRLRIKTSKDIVDNISGQGYLISVFNS